MTVTPLLVTVTPLLATVTPLLVTVTAVSDCDTAVSDCDIASTKVHGHAGVKGMTEQTDWRAKRPSQVACFSEDVKC